MNNSFKFFFLWYTIKNKYSFKNNPENKKLFFFSEKKLGLPSPSYLFCEMIYSDLNQYDTACFFRFGNRIQSRETFNLSDIFYFKFRLQFPVLLYYEWFFILSFCHSLLCKLFCNSKSLIFRLCFSTCLILSFIKI